MDLDGDGKLDLVAGDTEGKITFYKNIGTKTEPKLAEGKLLQADGKVISAKTGGMMGDYSKIHLTDWDGDGLLDILVGQDPPPGGAQLLLYKNIGTKTEPKFAAPVALDVIKGQRLSRPSPYVVDWDGDGKRDMLLGTDNGQVYFLKNIGTNEKPQFAEPVALDLKGMGKVLRARIAVVDWNNDGKLDLLVGTFFSEGKARGGNVWLFLQK